uniref:DNA polymerase nu n=1 Tax=Crocodylus porosus TaxID=8502 RepID=A0A7M4FRH9_CROPO
MEHYKEYVGCDLCKMPLSNIAQRIMSSAYTEKNTSLKNEVFCNRETSMGLLLPRFCSSAVLSNQNYYSNAILSLPKWHSGEGNSSVKTKENKDCEKNLRESSSLKRKRDVSMYCSQKLEKWLPEKHSINPCKTKCDWTSKQGESPEKAFCDVRNLEYEEKIQFLGTIKRALAVVITMVFQDGSSQLNSDQDLTSSVKGIAVLVKSQSDHLCPSSGCSIANPLNTCDRNDKLVYLKLEHTSVRGQEEQAHKQYSRQILIQILQCKGTVVCFNAKDFLRTLLHVYGNEICWKQVADCVVLDPRIAAWLINPSDTVPSFEYLILKHFKKPLSTRMVNMNMGLLKILSSYYVALFISNLFFYFILIYKPVFTVMETHKIHVNKEELKRTSEILGLRLKELEQEAHQAAGQQFLLTSSCQLREVLFRLLLFFLNKLQDLHPLPKIILEYRQGFLSSTWNQTGTVTGRLSAKHPNIQGISKHPVQIIKKHIYQNILLNEMVITYKFYLLDFSQIELRILAHLSCDTELLKLFQEPESSDVFTVMASQWKGIPSKQVKHADREQTKRIVYSVIYGAGKDHLAGCLGITPPEASQFIESFLQKYKKVRDFTKKTIEQCRHKGYVVSIMGRKRPLPNISTQDYRLRTQAERQAVNFVVQGSAADLCKMAMVEIFTSVALSPTLTARLIAQIHDELLFEVEDSQIQEFSVAAVISHSDRPWGTPPQLLTGCWGGMWSLLPPLQGSHQLPMSDVNHLKENKNIRNNHHGLTKSK